MRFSGLQNKVGAFTEGIALKRVSGGQMRAGAWGPSPGCGRAQNGALVCGLAILNADHAAH